MDFPDNAITNVHKIDGVHSIRWALYALENDVGVKVKDLSPGSRPDFDQILQLRSIEYELRSNGYHVHYDVDRNSIWGFDLPSSGSTAGQKSASNDDVMQLITRFGMRRTCFDSLKASELNLDSGADPSALRIAKPAGSCQAGLTDPQKMNLQNQGLNPISSNPADASLPDASSSTFGVASIVSSLGEAIVASIIYSLAATKSLPPINSRSCIQSLSLGYSITSRAEVCLEHHRLQTSLNSIRTQWSPFGTLTIIISQELVPGLCRVSEVLDNSFPLTEFCPIRKILVSPSGQIFQYSRELEFSVDSPDPGLAPSLYHLFKAKESIARNLALQGIQVTAEDRWILLQDYIKTRSAGNIDGNVGDSVSLVRFLWPAKLSFCLIEGSADALSYKDIDEDTGSDPLVWAESWFEGRNGREEAIEAKRKDDDWNAQQVKEAQDVNLDEDIYDFTIRDLGDQDTSGLFPTPSDGFRSQTEAVTNNAERKPLGAEFTDRETADGAENGAIPTESPFDNLSGPNTLATRYEHHDDADLFEEMDSGLFAANGLTEADFSFFDEPSIEVEPDLHDDPEAQSEAGETLEPSLVSDGGMLKKKLVDETPAFAAASAHREAITRIDMRQVPNDTESLLYSNAVSKHEGPLDSVIDLADSASRALRLDPEGRTSFDSVMFRDQFQEFDRKYVIRGRFGFELDPAPLGPMLREQPQLNRIVPRIGLAPEEDTESHETIETSSDQEFYDTDNDAHTDVSSPPQDETIPTATDDGGTSASRKRKRNRDCEGPITQRSTSDDDLFEESIYYPAAHLFAACTSTSNFPDVSPCIFLQIQSSTVPSYRGKDRAFMQVAEILINQIILQTQSAAENTNFRNLYNYQIPTGAQSEHQYAFRDVIQQMFPLSEQCSLGQYANIDREIYETRAVGAQPPQKGKTIILKPRSPGKNRNSLLKLQTPYACVRRNQSSIDLLASALQFWEELGLEPSYESKDVSAVYIFPSGENMQHGVEMFSRMMGNTYQSCKLGSHSDFFLPIGGYHSGLVPFPLHKEHAFEVIRELGASCEKLGADLAQSKSQGGNTVVYMINPFENFHLLAHLCAAFSRLFDSYLAALKSSHIEKPNDLILQIIPRSFIASATTIALPSPEDYKRLSFEVYDRCGPSESAQLGHSGFFCAPSIRLARMMPKTINLKLSREPSTGILSSDMCVHLAYSWDPTQHWLTASWTDNQGDLQWNAPYCLGGTEDEGEDPWPVFSAIVREMWETTLEMLSPQNSPWKLFVVKDSPMLKRELEVWLSVSAPSSLPSTQPSLITTLLTIDAHPPLQFYQPPNSSSSSSSPVPATTHDTPTPTPLTPAADPTILPCDPSAKLYDITSDTWSLIFPHFLTDLPLPSGQVNTCQFNLPLNHIATCRPLLSGYLLKRIDPSPSASTTSSLLATMVQLIHTAGSGGQQRTGFDNHEQGLLEDVLGMYGALGALARLRRVVSAGEGSGLLPWHVLAAMKARVGLLGMRWGD